MIYFCLGLGVVSAGTCVFRRWKIERGCGFVGLPLNARRLPAGAGRTPACNCWVMSIVAAIPVSHINAGRDEVRRKPEKNRESKRDSLRRPDIAMRRRDVRRHVTCDVTHTRHAFLQVLAARLCRT